MSDQPEKVSLEERWKKLYRTAVGRLPIYWKSVSGVDDCNTGAGLLIETLKEFHRTIEKAQRLSNADRPKTAMSYEMAMLDCCEVAQRVLTSFDKIYAAFNFCGRSKGLFYDPDLAVQNLLLRRSCELVVSFSVEERGATATFERLTDGQKGVLFDRMGCVTSLLIARVCDVLDTVLKSTNVESTVLKLLANKFSV